MDKDNKEKDEQLNKEEVTQEEPIAENTDKKESPLPVEEKDEQLNKEEVTQEEPIDVNTDKKESPLPVEEKEDKTWKTVVVLIGTLTLIVSLIFIYGKLKPPTIETTKSEEVRSTEQESANVATSKENEVTTSVEKEKPNTVEDINDDAVALSEEEYLEMVRTSLSKESDYKYTMELREFSEFMNKEGKNKEVFVYFFSPVCGFCIDTTPKLVTAFEEVSKDKPNIALVQLDVTKNDGILFDIGDLSGTPTLLRVVNGKEVSRSVGGGMPTEFYKDYLSGADYSYLTDKSDNRVIDNTFETDILKKLNKIQFVDK